MSLLNTIYHALQSDHAGVFLVVFGVLIGRVVVKHWPRKKARKQPANRSKPKPLRMFDEPIGSSTGSDDAMPSIGRPTAGFLVGGAIAGAGFAERQSRHDSGDVLSNSSLFGDIFSSSSADSTPSKTHSPFDSFIWDPCSSSSADPRSEETPSPFDSLLGKSFPSDSSWEKSSSIHDEW